MNICRVIGCLNTPLGKSYRCEEHATTCLAEGCTIETGVSVRCPKHASRHTIHGRSALVCLHIGCLGEPTEDFCTCVEHRSGADDLQERLNAAWALLKEHGVLTGKYTRHTVESF